MAKKKPTRAQTPWDELNQLVTSTTSERVLAERIEQERRRRGWSQERLAKEMTAAGVPMHQSAISKIEKPSRSDGRRAITVEEALGFARVFDLPLLTLLAPAAAQDELDQLTTFSEGPSRKLAADQAYGEYMSAVVTIARLVAQDVAPWPQRVEDARVEAKTKTLAAVYDIEDQAAVEFYEAIQAHAEELS